MRELGTWAAACAVSFVLGSLPIGLWWGRLWRGIDVREHGSRNLGATNVFRLLGPAHGVAVLLLDAAKGALAVLLTRRLVGSETAALLAGMVTVLGHVFSPWVRFRGGKGVATGLGVWLLLAPLATGIALAVWGAAVGISRRVSVGSLLASAVLFPAVCLTASPDGRVARVIAAGVTAALVWVRHRGNIVRLGRGEEPPLWGTRP